MWKKIALISIGVWVLSLISLGYFFVKGNTRTGTDGRLSIGLTPSEKDIVLTEMRALLEAVQMILEGLQENDMKVVELSASGVGKKAAADVDPRLMLKLPKEFKDTGMQLHERFDELALKVRAGAGKEEILSELSDSLRTCVGCHQAYRIDVE